MATAFKQVADNATSTTITNLTSTGVTAITVGAGDGTKFPAPGNGFFLTLWNGSSAGADPNMEKVAVTGRTGDLLATAPTTKAHTSPCNVGLLDASGNIVDLQVAVNAVENTLATAAHLGTDGKVGGPSGSPLAVGIVTSSAAGTTQIPVSDGAGNYSWISYSGGGSPATFNSTGIVRQREYNVKNYGAVADGKQVADAAISASGTTLSSATAAFTLADQGKLIVVFGAGVAGANLATTIQTYTNATTVTLAAAAGTTVTGALILYGTDDTSAINAAIAAVAVTGGILFFPMGQYCIGGTTTPVPGGVAVRGTGYDVVYPGPTGRSQLMSVLFACASIPYTIRIGNTTSSGPGTSLKEITVDGCGLATDAVYVGGARTIIESCYILAGTTNAINMSGQNTMVRLSYVSNEGVGNVISMGSAGDNKIVMNNLKACGPTGAIITCNGHCIISQNHLWQGVNGIPTLGKEIVINGSNFGIVIDGNLFDSTLSSHIYLNGGGEINITGNHFFMTTPVTDATLSCIVVTDVSVSLTASANTVGGFGASNRYKAFITSSAGAVDRSAFYGNVGNYVAAPFSGMVPTSHSGNMFSTGASTSKYGDDSGTNTFSGDGTTTSFTIPHSIYKIPIKWQVTAASAAAGGYSYVTADATNLYVNYSVAPASGTNNVILKWNASA